MSQTSYDVRVHAVEKRRNAKGKVTSHRVLWDVDGNRFREPFKLDAQADSFRSSLLVAARRGEAFLISTGRPVSWKQRAPEVTWYALMLDYTSAKWPYIAGTHRRSIAAALTDATEAMLLDSPGRPERSELRKALRSWVFSARIRDESDPPGGVAGTIRWLEGNTKPVSALAETDGSGAAQCRALLDRLSRKLDGTPAAANTANRNRMVLNNVLEYAVEVGLLTANPLKRVKWIKPKTAESVDPRSVINADQARQLLTAVRAQGKLGQHLEAFFALMYYAALRPEEAVNLTREQLISLPAEGWGEVLLSGATPYVGAQWTDDGKSRQQRALKHRAKGDTRRVPLHPELVAILRAHIYREKVGPGKRLFRGPRGGMLGTTTYCNIWRRARQTVWGVVKAAKSLLARRPYDLRHACVSTWLAAGVPAPQVAEWAGHSVAVLLRVYAKCISGQAAAMLHRITDATKPKEAPDSG